MFLNKLKEEIVELSKKTHVDKATIAAFLKRLQNNPRVTKYQGAADHICAFFVPVHRQTKSIYLGHHIKADDWIPPGGHVDTNELPKETVRREFEEELRVPLGKSPIEFFDISIKEINKPKLGCLRHYDFWHVVYTDKYEFDFDKREFHQAGWFSFKEGIKKIKFPLYRDIVKKLEKII